MAIKKAQQAVNDNPLYQVPVHLRNAPTNLMKSIGYGKEYKYPHDHEENFVGQSYFPKDLKDNQFYFPTDNGQEKGIKERLKRLWNKGKKY